MNPEQQRAILSLALLAAFADGEKHAREREEIRRIADALASDAGAPDLMRLYQDVLLKRASLESAAAALTEAEHRQLAYEMAICVCGCATPSRTCWGPPSRCRRAICRKSASRPKPSTWAG